MRLARIIVIGMSNFSFLALIKRGLKDRVESRSGRKNGTREEVLWGIWNIEWWAMLMAMKTQIRQTHIRRHPNPSHQGLNWSCFGRDSGAELSQAINFFNSMLQSQGSTAWNGRGWSGVNRVNR